MITCSRCVIMNDEKNFVAYSHRQFPTNEYNVAPHAPQSIFLNANKKNVEGGVAFTNLLPCSDCARLLCAAGIKKIVYKGDNPKENETLIAQICDHYKVELVKNTEIDFEE